MKDYKIILFLCNWGAHAAYQTLLDQGWPAPAEINMIRIPCTGRISRALLFKAFEMGADGVALVGCKPGSCRYGLGTENANTNTHDTRDILALLGVGRERLRLATFLPDEADGLRDFIETFCGTIKTIGKTPVVTARQQADKAGIPAGPDSGLISGVLSAHNAYGCQDCGKCTSTCPLALTGKQFSPRAMAGAVIAGDLNTKELTEDIWSCLTCGICYERCPSGVNFPDFICDIRSIVKNREDGDRHLAHGGFFQSLMRAMTSPALSTKRWQDLPDGIRVDAGSKVLFFGGCAPYFDTFFRAHLGVKTSEILTDSLRLLNFFDVVPALLENERCCGHDLLWSGDRENFLRLARLNVAMIEERGIEEVVTACPECYRTLAEDYARFGIAGNFKVTHFYEFLEREIDKSAVTFAPLENAITFQDSCRMNGVAHLRDLPRKLIQRLVPDQFAEMKDRQAVSMCCGSSAWTGCDAYSKAMQVKRLRQAHDTGSNLLVTACPKCQIHLQCAMEDPIHGDSLKMEMADLTSIIRQTIRWE
ncbi:MAG: hydrogenase iron-sulfur subunit [Desulfobacteraceae bacterium]|nr:MAG: hydrogenase iron-sulfur subunit [Desulfobacteraceae bacterium]